MNRIRLLAAVALLSLVPLEGLEAQAAAGPWRFLARAGLSGASHASEPEGYQVFSGLGFDLALARTLSSRLWAELSFRLESREVQGPVLPGESNHLGSLELMPVRLTMLFRPLGNGGGRLQPYLGGGLAATVTWEKSGALDSTDVPTSLDPVVQLGSTFAVSAHAVLSLDVKWNTLDIAIERLTDPIPSIAIDPLTLGLGLGFAF